MENWKGRDVHFCGDFLYSLIVNGIADNSQASIGKAHVTTAPIQSPAAEIATSIIFRIRVLKIQHLILNYAEKRLDIYAVAFADSGAVHWQDNKTVGLGHGA